jgi:hypothetical protein
VLDRKLLSRDVRIVGAIVEGVESSEFGDESVWSVCPKLDGFVPTMIVFQICSECGDAFQLGEDVCVYVL